MTNPTNEDAIQAWNAAGAHVNDFGPEGDVPRQLLLNPAIFAQLGDVAGRRILDAGCGQGYLARLLARRGARVTGVELATTWLAAARAHEQAEPLGITYVQADLAAFDPADHGLPPFDAVVANMVLIDIPDDVPAIHRCLAALKPGGSFVFTLAHPCFEDTADDWARDGALTVRAYLADYAIAQTFGQRFHRPLSHYLNATIAAGGVLRAIVEPRLDDAWAAHGPWYARNTRVPSYLVVHATRA